MFTAITKRSKQMTNQLVTEALQGYTTPTGPCPFLSTSISADAWAIGRWLQQNSRTAPRDVRKSRGDTYHVNGMKVQIHYVQGCTEVERIG
jgi:hypothetical protein